MRGLPFVRWLGVAVATLLSAAVLVACTPTDDPVAEVVEPLPPPNFVFVLIDTLRADHVGAYGYTSDTTPFIDSLAAKGLVFEHAVSQAPWTGSSMASIWTSRYPSEVGAGVLPDESGQRFLAKTGSTKLRRDVPTVAQVLSGAGYRTMALVSNVYAGGFFGLLRGYDVARQKSMDAKGVTDRAIALLTKERAEGRADPFFLYVHYLDAHEPTFPPPAYRAKFPAADGEPHTKVHARWKYGRGFDAADPEYAAFRDHKLKLYDASIHFVDAQVRRLAEYLESVGLLDDTVFVIASDHGEEFWDHTEFESEHHLDPRGLSGIGHGQSLFGELTDVPLILSGPGVPAGRVSSVVRNLDIAPTLYGLAQVDVGEAQLHGVDLRSVAAQTEAASLDAYSESISYGVEAQSLEKGGWKLIRYSDTKGDQKEFLYERSIDRAEAEDLAAEQPEARAALSAALDAKIAAMSGVRGATTELDAKTRAQLEAIGYLE